MKLAEIKIEPITGKRLYVTGITELRDWPSDFLARSRHFGLLLATEKSLADEEVLSFAERVIRQGCAYMLSWGPGCERVHDIFDEARNRLGGNAEAVMTVWEDEGPLNEAVWEFVFSAPVDEELADDCASWIAVAVGSDVLTKQLSNLVLDLQMD